MLSKSFTKMEQCGLPMEVTVACTSPRWVRRAKPLMGGGKSPASNGILAGSRTGAPMPTRNSHLPFHSFTFWRDFRRMRCCVGVGPRRSMAGARRLPRHRRRLPRHRVRCAPGLPFSGPGPFLFAPSQVSGFRRLPRSFIGHAGRTMVERRLGFLYFVVCGALLCIGARLFQLQVLGITAEDPDAVLRKPLPLEEVAAPRGRFWTAGEKSSPSTNRLASWRSSIGSFSSCTRCRATI